VVELCALAAFAYFVRHGEENVATGIIIVVDIVVDDVLVMVVVVAPGETTGDVGIDLGGRNHHFVGQGMFWSGNTVDGNAARGGAKKQGPFVERMAIVLPGEDVDDDA
jgi:hypothetical protein